MIARIWSGESPLWRLLLPLSWLYGLVSGLIRLSYRLGLKKAWRAPVPVVVVGNLTAGGNGKTPVVIWLVEQLQQRGIRVGVVSRGYGGKAASYPLVLNSTTGTSEAGDEPVLIYQRTGAPVAVSPSAARRCGHCLPYRICSLSSPTMACSTTGWRAIKKSWLLTAYAALATAGGYRPGRCANAPRACAASTPLSLTAASRGRER